MKTFKVTVCTAMLCAVTAVFAWDVEHDEIARLTGEALPAEIRAFFSFEDFGVLTGNCHFPDMTESEPRRWRTVDDMTRWVDAEDRAILEKAGCRGYWLHTEEGKSVVLTLLSRAFATGAHTKAAFYLSLLTHSVSDESALNHPTLGNYHRYTKFAGVQYPSRKIEPGAKNVFGFRSDGPVAEKARERLAKRRQFRGADASFDDALLRFAVEAVRQGAYSAEKEGAVFFAPLPEATEALADLVAMQVDAIIDMAETAWRFRRADQPLPPPDFKQRSTKAAQKFVRTLDPFRESVWAGLADARLDPPAPKGVVGVVCEPYGVRGDSYMTYAGKVIAAAAARTLRDNGYAIKALSFWQVDKEKLPSPDAMPILLLVRGSWSLPEGVVKAVRAYLAAGGRLVLVGGSDPENLTGFSRAFVKRGDKEVPASGRWAGANAGDWRKMSVYFDGKVFPQRQDANVDGYCKPRCLLSIDTKAPGVEPFAEFSAGGARFAVAARKGNVAWVPQYLLMPFLYTNETTADWAAQRLDAFGTRVLLKAIAGDVRVTDSVNAGASPARLPQGAEAFEVERPRAHGGAVVNAADFGFSATNDLNAAVVMCALEHCRRTKASRLVLAPGTYNCFDPDHGLVVADMEDFTLDGAGATLVFRRPVRRLSANSDRIPHDSSLLVTNCQRCVVGNFSIDWDWKNDPLCDVGVVVSTHVDEAENGSYCDLNLPDWPQGHPWYGRPMPIQTMTPINAERTRLTAEAPSRLLFGLTEGHFGTKMAWLSPHAVRVWPGVREPGQYAAPVNDHYYGAAINRRTVAQMRKGVLYRVFHYYYGKNGITMHSGRHVTVENVNVLGCFGMPIVVDGAQEYGEFRKVVVEPVPGRPCTGTSDGCHVARSKGHIKFIDCVISFQNDDGLNIHDCFTLGVPDGPRRIRVTNVRGPEYLGAQPGNELELLAPNFRPLGWKGRLLATEGDCLVVDRDLPPLAGEHFLVFDNTFQSDHIVMRGCTFHDTHFREIVQPKHVTVEDCRFIRMGSGFKMGSAHSREFWCEGRGSRDVVIRRCTFEHDCTLADWSRAALPVFETYVRFPRPKPYPPGNNVFTMEPPAGFDIAFHGDILVEKCTITDPSGPLFVGNPVSNLIFRDNEIVLTGARRVDKTTGSFVFGSARDVFITGNRYVVAPALGAFVPFVKGDVPGLTVAGNVINTQN